MDNIGFLNKVYPYNGEVNDSIEYNKYLEAIKLIDLLLSIFEWEIPKDVPLLRQEIIEWRFMMLGYCAFRYHNEYGYYVPYVVGSNDLNIYGYTNQFNLYVDNGMINETNINIDDFILAFNNKSHTGYMQLVDYYSTILAEIEIVKRQNLKLSRGYITISTNDAKNELAVKQIIKDWLGFKAFTTKDNHMESNIEVTSGDIAFKGTEYNTYRKMEKGNFLEDVGINAIDIEKGSHLLEKEATRSEASSIKIVQMYQNRLNFCKAIKEKYGLDFKVSLNINNVRKLLDEFMEGDDNENNNENIVPDESRQ